MQLAPSAVPGNDLSNFMLALQPSRTNAAPSALQQLDVANAHKIIRDKQQLLLPIQQQLAGTLKTAAACTTSTFAANTGAKAKAEPQKKGKRRTKNKDAETTEVEVSETASSAEAAAAAATLTSVSRKRLRKTEEVVPPTLVTVKTKVEKVEKADSDDSSKSKSSSSGLEGEKKGGENELVRSKKLINMLNSRENRKRKRQELKTLKDHGEEMELLKKLLGSFSRVILVHDKAGDILFATCTGVIQYDQKDLIGRNLHDITANSSTFKERTEESRKGEKKKRRSKRMKLRKPDGTQLVCL
jgi:hypothetical protein